jgi:hypothetical protein
MTDSHPEDGVLTPEELTPKSDDLAELSEKRFVVRTGESDDATGDDALRAPPVQRSDSADARLAADPQPHGIDLSLKLDGRVSSHYATSTDVREVFVELLTWYADQLDDEMTPEGTLWLIFEHSDLVV